MQKKLNGCFSENLKQKINFFVFILLSFNLSQKATNFEMIVMDLSFRTHQHAFDHSPNHSLLTQSCHPFPCPSIFLGFTHVGYILIPNVQTYACVVVVLGTLQLTQFSIHKYTIKTHNFASCSIPTTCASYPMLTKLTWLCNISNKQGKLDLILCSLVLRGCQIFPTYKENI